MTYDERIDMIREVHHRLYGKPRKTRVKSYDEGESEIRWSDEAKYVTEHYGERAAAQRQYESDWS